MFKLLQNLLPNDTGMKTDSTDSESDISDTSWKAQIAKADALWEQGKLSEALALYGLAIEQNPHTVEIREYLAGRIKHQGDIAVAYEKLATELKNQGEIEQAANYYRQAINLKVLTGNTKDTLSKLSTTANEKSPIPLASLKEAAFSFQPLGNGSAMIKSPLSQTSQLKKAASKSNTFNGTSSKFTPRLKTIDPMQSKGIDWETAQVYLQKALAHLEQQEWQQSALACRQATKIMPQMAEAYKIWGNALQRMGKTGEAMSCYAKAVEIKPNLAEVYAGIAGIYVQQERWQQAVKHYQKAIIIKPSAEIHRSLAGVWQKLGESEKVEFHLYEATQLEVSETASQVSVESDPANGDRHNLEESIEAYCETARRLEQQNRWQQAAKYYRQALDLSMSRLSLPPQQSPESDRRQPVTSEAIPLPPRESNSDRPTERSAQSQLDKAIARYHQQAKLQPNSPKIFTDLGNLYARKGKLHHAIACYRKSIELNRKYAKAHLNLGRILLKVGKQQEFIQEMQLALTLEPKIGTALDRFYLGNALVDRGQEQQAIGYYYKAIVLNPKFSQSYRRLSEILSKRGKHEKAIEFLEQEINHNPQDPESYFFLGQQWEILQKWENAVKLYSQVLRLDPQFPEASQKLNHALAEKLKSNRKLKSSLAN